jgi:hypothetical protein
MGYLEDLKTQRKPSLPPSYPKQYALYRKQERPVGPDLAKSYRIYRAGERPPGYSGASQSATPAHPPRVSTALTSAIRGAGSGTGASGYGNIAAPVGEAAMGPWGMNEAAAKQVALVKDWMLNELIPAAREQEAARGMLNSGIAMGVEAQARRKAALEADSIMADAAAEEGRLNQQVALSNAANILEREMANQSTDVEHDKIRSDWDQFTADLGFRTRESSEKTRLSWADLARQGAVDKAQYGVGGGAGGGYNATVQFTKDLPNIMASIQQEGMAGPINAAAWIQQLKAGYPGVDPMSYPEIVRLLDMAARGSNIPGSLSYTPGSATGGTGAYASLRRQ